MYSWFRNIGSDGSLLHYNGYIECSVRVLDIEMFVPILIVPETGFSMNCPVIIGTMLVRVCRDHWSDMSFAQDMAGCSKLYDLQIILCKNNTKVRYNSCTLSIGWWYCKRMSAEIFPLLLLKDQCQLHSVPKSQ